MISLDTVSTTQIASHCQRFNIRGDLDLMNFLISERLIEPTLVEREVKKVSLNMFNVMREVELLIPPLLKERVKWKSLYIDYRPPHLMRIFTDVISKELGDKPVRISLHYFLPVQEVELKAHENSDKEFEASLTSGENLYHPHGWASCMRIIEGLYDQSIGFADRPGVDVMPRKMCSLTHSAQDSYAMNHPWLWHQVNPRPNLPVSTLMVTYIPKQWDQEVPRPTKPQRSLTEKEIQFMFTHFENLYDTVL